METNDQKTIVVNVNLTRRLITFLFCVLLVAAFLVYVAIEHRDVDASAPKSITATGMRQFYMTKTYHTGSQVLTACASGYHMASLWEIWDPSNLVYNTTLGATDDDSGQGPISSGAAWVRTGYSSSSANDSNANCSVWTSNSSGDYGSLARLNPDWEGTYGPYVFPHWQTWPTACNDQRSVWCVENAGASVYLPLINR